VKRLPPGESISYGGHYQTHKKPHTTIITLPLGYADGYRRLLGAMKQEDGKTRNHGWSVLIRGHKAPIVGRVCMDMFMVDATEVESKTLETQGPIRENEEVTLMGQQGNSTISCDDMADRLGTITYEITCLVGKRVPRLYRDNGQVVRAKSLLGRFEVVDDLTLPNPPQTKNIRQD
jgi:alanine racemase